MTVMMLPACSQWLEGYRCGVAGAGNRDRDRGKMHSQPAPTGFQCHKKIGCRGRAGIAIARPAGPNRPCPLSLC